MEDSSNSTEKSNPVFRSVFEGSGVGRELNLSELEAVSGGGGDCQDGSLSITKRFAE